MQDDRELDEPIVLDAQALLGVSQVTKVATKAENSSLTSLGRLLSKIGNDKEEVSGEPG